MLRSSGAFDELGFEDVVRSIFRWAEEEISDFCGELWTERADNVVELRILRSDAASGELSLDLGELGSAGQKGGSLMLMAAVKEATAA